MIIDDEFVHMPDYYYDSYSMSLSLGQTAFIIIATCTVKIICVIINSYLLLVVT